MPVEAGLILKTDDDPVPERSGFHASVSPMDALRFFAVRPNDRIIVSRVKLSGKIVQAANTLVAQQREHLWTADAEAALETLALSYIQRAVAWVSIEGVTVPQVIYDAIEVRRRWFAKGASQTELVKAAEALVAWGNQQTHPLDGLKLMGGWWKLTSAAKQYTADDWMDYHQQCMTQEPVILARELSKCIRRDTQFFVLDAPGIAAQCRDVICNFDGWRDALAANAPVIPDHIAMYRRSESYGVRPSIPPLEAPPPYLDHCKLQPLYPNADLHQRLMRLAPDGYSES